MRLFGLILDPLTQGYHDLWHAIEQDAVLQSKVPVTKAMLGRASKTSPEKMQTSVMFAG